ncbi:hypothetical protein EJG51_012135 [Undibacterium piscinae]|jgi:hypothetical protein|uniref:Uncharacterized protein n=1 Tax=Undibacterium piscinae TaxID=2495591 RepID=A0A6M4A8V9_9BURK|nr:hypothetical protein EJG51_012135 [Undibacterium piscinae]
MSFLNIALPIAQIAMTNILAVARPLLGLAILVTILIVFKPLLLGMLRAALLVVHPKLTRDQKTASRNLRNMLTIRRIANDVNYSSPNMAAELRALASRG